MKLKRIALLFACLCCIIKPSLGETKDEIIKKEVLDINATKLYEKPRRKIKVYFHYDGQLLRQIEKYTMEFRKQDFRRGDNIIGSDKSSTKRQRNKGSGSTVSRGAAAKRAKDAQMQGPSPAGSSGTNVQV